MRRALALAGLALLVAVFAATARYVVWAPSDAPGRADAVVVLAGGRGERLEEATRLMDAGTARVLAVSHGRQPGWTEGNRLCNGVERYEVVCFEPEPDRTYGEARAVRRLAGERGWRSVVVVTSRYHVTRATMLVDRCFDGDVRGVGARPPGWGGLPTIRNIAREWASYVHAHAVKRDC